MARCHICHRRLPAGTVCPQDQIRVAEQHLQAFIGETPPGYAEASVLGVGGFATTWGVRDSSGTACALKWGRRATEAAVFRFAKEAELLRTAGPTVAPKLFATGTMLGRPYLLQERLQGQTLGQQLEQLPTIMPIETALETATAIANTLTLLHEKQLVHRDIKPDNIFIHEGIVRLIDFGVSERRDVEGGARGGGTPQYAAPEQWRGAPVDGSADIYSWGVILYELLCMRPPFVGEGKSIEYQHATLRPPRPSEFSRIPAALEELLLATLAKNPIDRPSASELLKRLPEVGQGRLAPTTQAVSHAAVLLPTWLLVAEIEIDAGLVQTLVDTHGAELISHRGKQLLFAWPSDGHQTSAALAEGCAAELVEWGATRCLLNLERVSSMHRAGERFLFGTRLEDLGAWWPMESWAGLRRTKTAEAALAPTKLRVRMVGREDQLKMLCQEAELAFAQERPRMVCLSGPPGIGTSRLLEEVATRICAEESVRCLRIDGENASTLDGGEAVIDMGFEGPVLVLVDELQALDSDTLGALEYAMLPGTQRPILLLATASSSFASQRPGWGSRCEHAQTIVLDRLDDGAGSILMRELLRPAEYVPASALKELATLCGGVPGAALDLVASLHREGFIACGEGGAYRLDTERLANLPTDPSGDWIASRALESLGRPVAALAMVCSVLVARFSESLVVKVSEKLSFRNELAECSIALFSLGEQGILLEREGRYTFARESTRAALIERLDPARRREVHDVALRTWQHEEEGSEALEALAFHGAAVGEAVLAAGAHVRLGDWQATYHRATQAHRHYSAAVALLEAEQGETLLLQALQGIGWAGYRIDRALDAVRALDRAEGLAERLGKPELQILILLECATALDWAQRHQESRDYVVRASDLATRTGLTTDVVVSLRLELGLGRNAWRACDNETALGHLHNAVEAAAAADDFDTRVVALMLLAPALVVAGELDAAEGRFEELVGLCEPANDRLHLCAAYGNRMFLWSARKQPQRAREDLRMAMRLAQQIGHPGPERVATYNLAEDLYWSGEYDEEALQLAKRSQELAARFIDHPVVEDALLVARCALALDDLELVTERLAWVRAEFSDECLVGASELFVSMLKLCLGEGEESWANLLDRGAQVMAGDDLLELHYWQLRLTQESTDYEDLLKEHVIWQERFDRLAAVLTAGHKP